MTNGGVTGVARSTVEALKDSPALLMIIVLNVLMLGVIIYVGRVQYDERREIRLKDESLIKMLTDMCNRRDGTPTP